jgi:hypothetical protein
MEICAHEHVHHHQLWQLVQRGRIAGATRLLLHDHIPFWIRLLEILISSQVMQGMNFRLAFRLTF